MNLIYRKKIAITSLIIILFCSFIYLKSKEKSYILNEYENNLISYFKEIALQSEYYDSTKKVVKWVEPMVLFIRKGEDFKSQMLAIETTITKINQLATDGFKIRLTDDISKSNSVLFLCNKNSLLKSAPYFYDIVTEGRDYDISGYAYSEFIIETGIIDKSLIFIDSDEPIDYQESTILEEITQSLGLAFDSKKYSNSVFYKNKYDLDYEIKEYSKIDIDIIRLLYHPDMKPGLDSFEVEKVIKKILKFEK